LNDPVGQQQQRILSEPFDDHERQFCPVCGISMGACPTLSKSA
jgi:hypothetical protein